MFFRTEPIFGILHRRFDNEVIMIWTISESSLDVLQMTTTAVLKHISRIFLIIHFFQTYALIEILFKNSNKHYL